MKEQTAEDFAKFLALSQKNLNQLKQRFLENLDEDLGANKRRSEKLNEIIEDLDSISNGHLEAIVVKKEKVKFQVLQNSSDEETSKKANGKKGPEEVVLSDDTDELASSSDNSEDDPNDSEAEERRARKIARKVGFLKKLIIIFLICWKNCKSVCSIFSIFFKIVLNVNFLFVCISVNVC